MAADGFPPERSFVKPNFVRPSPVAQTQTEDVVVYAGRLTESKGVHTLIDAWDAYCSRSPRSSLRLVVAGAGPLQQRVAAWAAARPSVEFAGMLSPEACRSLMARARAVIAPSQWEETFGLVIVEAMAVGVPSVASNHGSFPELIQDGVDGVLVDPGNAHTLAAVLQDIEVQPERYRALGHAARRTYEKRFTVDANVEQLLRIYQFAIRQPAP
ncbi:MAG TPA: glycosyltransferase [Acidimicrobiales bacterium]|nr:glycosyltransferase [Acidimicrobiales bacterium]